MLFGLLMAALMMYNFVVYKEPLTVIDGAFAGVPMILGFATAIPTSFSFVISTVKTIAPWGRRDGDH